MTTTAGEEHRPQVWLLAAALWAGCLLPGPWWIALVGLGGAAAACRERVGAARLAVVTASLLLAGSGLAGGRLALQEHAPLAAAEGAVVQVEAVAVTEARETARGQWLIVRVGSIDGRGVRDRALLRLPADEVAPALGQRLALRAAVEPLGDAGFDRHARTLHAVAALRPLGGIEARGAPGRTLHATTVVRDRTRQAARQRLDDDRAALLTALVTGDRRGESPERRAQFAASSLTHLVVVSGKHVGLALAGVVALAALAGVGARGRAWTALVALAWYVVLVRWQPSVLRAGAMAGLVLGAGLAGRRVDGRHALGTAVVLLLLVDPLLARHLGFALSVSATAGVLLGAPWLAARLPGPRWLRLPVAVCLGAQAGVSPLLVLLEGGVPIAALPANLLAVPAAGIAQAIGLVAAAVAQVSAPAGAVVAAAAGPSLGAVLWVAETFSGWPVLTPAVLASPPVAALAAAFLVRRRAPRVAVATLIAAALLAVFPALAPPKGVDALTVTLLDVGQGDAVLIEVPPGEGAPAARMLVDGGPDADAALAHLRARRIRSLDAVALSHPHHDHSGGLPEVLRRVAAGALVVGPDPIDERAPRSAHETYAVARQRAVPIIPTAAGDRFRLGAATITVLSPPPDGSVGTDLNEISLVLRVDHPDGRVLLTGDAEVLAQTLMLRDPEALRVDVLKVPHHGGATNAAGFLAATQARMALIGVGWENPFGHPHPAVLDDLAAAGMTVRRTDLHGTVSVPLPLDDWAAPTTSEAWQTARHGPPTGVPRHRAGRAARPPGRRAARRGVGRRGRDRAHGSRRRRARGRGAAGPAHRVVVRQPPRRAGA